MFRPILPQRLLGLLLVALVLSGTVGVAPVLAVSAGGAGTGTADGVVERVGDDRPNGVGDPTGTPSAVAGNATDATDETVDDGTNVTDETVDDATDATDETVDDATNATDETVDDATDATDDATAAVENATDAPNATVAADLGVGTGTADTTATRDPTPTVDPTPTDSPDGDPNVSGGGETGTTVAAAPANGSGDSGGGGCGVDGAVAGGAAALVGGAVAAGLYARGTLAVQAGGVGDAVVVGLRTATNAARGTAVREVVDSWRRWLVGLVGYGQYEESDPLEHDRRAAVYEAIRSSPGAYLSELDGRVEGSFSSLRHHLDVLDEADLIASAKIRGRRRYFPIDTEDPAFDAALNDEASAAVLDALARHGPASVSEVADHLDRDPSTATHHLSRLSEEGLVVRERRGRVVTNRLSADVAAMLDHRRGDSATGDD